MTISELYEQYFGKTDDFWEILTDHLLCLPETRASAVELLDAIDQWDDIRLYNTLLLDFEDFLRPDERERVIRQYKELFDDPLPIDIE